MYQIPQQTQDFETVKFYAMLNTKYPRVIPRDLFNEALLLKSMGRLILSIEDAKAMPGLTYKDNGKPFEIGLWDAGYLQITNIRIYLHGHLLNFLTTYNSRRNYPLIVFYDNCEYLVFDEDGSYSEEFKIFCKQFSKDKNLTP